MAIEKIYLIILAVIAVIAVIALVLVLTLPKSVMININHEPKKTLTRGSSLSEPLLVPIGKLPEDGREFIITSQNTGKYLCDDGVMSDDIKDSKIFKYDSKLGRTINAIENNTTADKNPSTQLCIYFSDTYALVGSYDTVKYCSNKSSYFAIILDSGNEWEWGTISCNAAAALLPEYRPAYSALFYYV
jgi:hypothetical protein